MKVECNHGYFKFTETQAGQITHFMSLFDLDISRSGDHFTFTDLVDAPHYSLAGGLFLDCPTLSTFEGTPAEVMRDNNLVYDFTLGLVVPIVSIIAHAKLSRSGFYFVSTGMLMPGSIKEDGSRVKDYSAQFLFDRVNFKYSEINYE